MALLTHNKCRGDEKQAVGKKKEHKHDKGKTQHNTDVVFNNKSKQRRHTHTQHALLHTAIQGSKSVAGLEFQPDPRSPFSLSHLCTGAGTMALILAM